MSPPAAKRLDFFERSPSLWVLACMLVGVAIGKLLPELTARTRSRGWYEGGIGAAPVMDRT